MQMSAKTSEFRLVLNEWEMVAAEDQLHCEQFDQYLILLGKFEIHVYNSFLLC